MPTYNVTVTDSLVTHEVTRPNIHTFLQDNSILRVKPFAAYGQSLLTNIGIHDVDTFQFQAGAAVVDAVRLHDALTPVSKYSRTLTTQLLLHDAIQRGFPVSLLTSLGIHDASKILQTVTVIDKLKLRDPPGALAKFAAALLENIKAHDVLLRFFGGGLVGGTGVGFHDTLTAVYQATARVSDRVTLAALLGGSLIFNITLSDEWDLLDTEILKMIYKGDHLLDTLQISAAYVDPGGGFTTWAINTRTSAVTEYQNYAFNSICKFGHRYLGADATGLWTLDGELDDAMSIPTQIKSGIMQLAGSRFTSFKAAYLGLRVKDGATDFLLKLHAGDGREYVYAVQPQNMQTTKVHMGKGLRSRYFAFELVTAGSDYDLDGVEFVPISSQRRV